MANTPNIDLVKPAGTDRALIATLNANSDKIDTAVGANQTAIGALPALVVNCGTISSLSTTISNSKITSDMVVVNSTLGTPSAMTSEWTINTANGSLTIAGSISGSTTLTLTLMKSRS